MLDQGGWTHSSSQSYSPSSSSLSSVEVVFEEGSAGSSVVEFVKVAEAEAERRTAVTEEVAVVGVEVPLPEGSVTFAAPFDVG